MKNQYIHIGKKNNFVKNYFRSIISNTPSPVSIASFGNCNFTLLLYLV